MIPWYSDNTDNLVTHSPPPQCAAPGDEDVEAADDAEVADAVPRLQRAVRLLGRGLRRRAGQAEPPRHRLGQGEGAPGRVHR